MPGSPLTLPFLYLSARKANCWEIQFFKQRGLTAITVVRVSKAPKKFKGQRGGRKWSRGETDSNQVLLKNNKNNILGERKFSSRKGCPDA